MKVSYNDEVIIRNTSILNKIRKKKQDFFLYNYEKNPIYKSDLEFIINTLDKKKLNLNNLNNKNKNFKKGVLATFLKLCHYTYYYNYIDKKNFFHIRILFSDTEMIVSEYNYHIFIALRGTSSFRQIEYLYDLALYKKIMTNDIIEPLFKKFEKWKHIILENYPLETILSRQFISTKFKFHKGFYDLYKDNKIYNKIRYILLSNKKYNNIYITGHSLGVSFGNLLILDLYNFSYIEKRKLKINMVSFGSPGSMNSNLSLFYFYLSSIGFLSKYIRIFNKNDIISSTFSNKDDYIGLWLGVLHHINSAIPKENKSIVSKHNFDCSKNFIILNTEKYGKPFFDKNNELTYEERHNLYCFSNESKACLFCL